MNTFDEDGRIWFSNCSDPNAWDYLEEHDYYMSFDPKWDETLDWIVMLPEVGEEL